MSNHQRPEKNVAEERPKQRSVAFQRRSFVVAELFLGDELSSSPSDNFQLGQETMGVCCNQSKQCFDSLLQHFEPKPLPEFYVLGRTTITIARCQLTTTMQRICKFIKMCSLDFQIIFDEARIDCRAPLGCLSFSIWIWKDRHDTNDDEVITIEVQRQHGCGVLMQRYKRALKILLRTGAEFDPYQLNRGTHPMPLQSPEMTDALMTVSISKHEEDDTLQRCCCMLERESYDENLLALESLVGMLKSKPGFHGTNHEVAEALVWRKDQSCSCILDRLSSFIIGNQQKRNGMDSIHLSNSESEEDGHMRRGLYELALHIMTFSLSLVVEHQKFADCSSKKYLSLDTKPWWKVIDALCYNVSIASTRPHEAALSAQCLLLLDALTLNNEIVDEISIRIIPSLIKAQKFGTMHNDKLGLEVQNLLFHIQDVVMSQ